jgi:Protein of unknown function (DUF2637)
VTSSWWHLARGRGARWGVVVLWVLGAVLSYSALRDLAVMLGFPVALADLFPLVIDVAVWVGSMNALEAREHGRRVVERYAWALVALYSSVTVAGNALVASTEAVDPRLIRALGDGSAHAVSSLAHAAPAVTMILFAHLAGLLMAGRSVPEEVTRADVAEPAPTVTGGRGHGDGLRSWPSLDDRSSGHVTGHDRGRPVMTATPMAADHGHDRDMAPAMTAAEARQAVVHLIREGRGRGHEVTAGDVQRLTGRGPRQARRLLAPAGRRARPRDLRVRRPAVRGRPMIPLTCRHRGQAAGHPGSSFRSRPGQRQDRPRCSAHGEEAAARSAGYSSSSSNLGSATRGNSMGATTSSSSCPPPASNSLTFSIRGKFPWSASQ